MRAATASGSLPRRQSSSPRKAARFRSSRRASEPEGELSSHAQPAGAIRSDIGPGDVTMLLSAISHATAHTGDPELRERYLSIVLDGLRPHAASPLPGGPVHFAEIQKAKSRT